MNKAIFTLVAMTLSSICMAGMTDPIGRTVNKNTKLPEGWLVQGQPEDKTLIKVIADQKGLSTALTFIPAKANLTLYCGNALSYRKGDVIKLHCKVKGTGRIQMGYFAYSDSNKYLLFTCGKTFELTGKAEKISDTFTVKDGTEAATFTIRPAVNILKDSNIELLGFSISDEEE